LSRSRVGRNSLTYAEIDAYCRLTGTKMKHWEIRLIYQLDAMWQDWQIKMDEMNRKFEEGATLG